MIVVIGAVNGESDDAGAITPAGFVAALASEAAAAGSHVEIVTRVGDDAAGDDILLAFAQAGVGHVATLRDAGTATPVVPAVPDPPDPDDHEAPASVGSEAAGPSLDGADVGLALRYLSDYRVIVLAHATEPEIVREAAAAAAWAAAHLVVVTSPDSDPGIGVDRALVLSAERDADETARRLGRYAAAVDAGEGLDRAYAVLTGANAES